METPTAPPDGTRSSGQLTAVLAGIVLVVSVVFISQASWSNAWYSAFKAVHVLAAVIWIGGGALLLILGLAAERKRDPIELATVARQAAMVGEKLFAPAGIVVVTMGVAMMVNTNWGWGKFWVVAGLVGYAITFVTGIAVLSPMTKRIAALTDEKGATHPETVAAITRVLQIVRIDIAMLLLVVVDMVVKPFS